MAAPTFAFTPRERIFYRDCSSRGKRSVGLLRGAKGVPLVSLILMKRPNPYSVLSFMQRGAVLTFRREWQAGSGLHYAKGASKKNSNQFQNIFTSRPTLLCRGSESARCRKSPVGPHCRRPLNGKIVPFLYSGLLKTSLRLRRLYFHVDKFNGYF